MSEAEKIETMARAICGAEAIDPDGLIWTIHAANVHQYPAWHDYMQHARAALAALSTKTMAKEDEDGE